MTGTNRLRGFLALTFTIISLSLSCGSAASAEFSWISGDGERDEVRLRISGEITSDIAERFESFVRSLSVCTDCFELAGSPMVELNSPGGSLAGGLELGRKLRKLRFSTIVRRNDICASACSFAYLGGTSSYVTNTDTGRYLEVGGVVGFHAFFAGTDRTVSLNEGLAASRIVNGEIYEYAIDMGDIEFKEFQRLLSAGPDDMHFAITPESILAIGAQLQNSAGGKLSPPLDWGRNACAHVISEQIPSLDSFGGAHERVRLRIWDVNDVSSLRNFLSMKINTPVAARLQGLDDDVAVRALLGRLMYGIEMISAYRTDRGAGFYYDYCVATRSDAGVEVYLIGEGSETVSVSLPWLRLFEPNTALWCSNLVDQNKCTDQQWKFEVAKEDWGASCTIMRKTNDASYLILTGEGTMNPVLVLKRSRLQRQKMDGTIYIGEYELSASLSPDDYFGGLSSYDIDDEFLTEFARGSEMSLFFTRGPSLHVELGGSSDAVSKFRACAKP